MREGVYDRANERSELALDGGSCRAIPQSGVGENIPPSGSVSAHVGFVETPKCALPGKEGLEPGKKPSNLNGLRRGNTYLEYRVKSDMQGKVRKWRWIKDF